jgi:hypothetical protein
VSFKRTALDLVAARKAEKEPVTEICGDLGIHRDTYYDWRRRGPDPPRRISGLSPELVGAMKDEVRRLCHVKRRTWKTPTVYAAYQGLIPRRVIARTIAEERRAQNQIRRQAAQRYEFAAPDVAHSVDLLFAPLGQRLLRLQDEFARYELQHESRPAWLTEDVTRWVERVFMEWKPPFVMKHDRGGELRSDYFQAMLRANKVIALPSPARRPQYNGKHERQNQHVQDWLHPLARSGLTRDEWLNEMRLASEDLNELRPRGILGNRTPHQVYFSTAPLSLDRDALYEEWSERCRELRLKRQYRCGMVFEGDLDLDAMRIAAVAVLQKHKLLWYFSSRRGPDV